MILNQESDSYFGYYVWMTPSNLEVDFASEIYVPFRDINPVRTVLFVVNIMIFLPDVSSMRTEISLLRRQILSALEQVMLGDSLAAEYFLCHLISSV